MFLFISFLNHAGLLNGNLTEHDAVNFVLKNNSSQSDNVSVVFQTYHASENISLFNEGKIWRFYFQPQLCEEICDFINYKLLN